MMAEHTTAHLPAAISDIIPTIQTETIRMLIFANWLGTNIFVGINQEKLAVINR
jgi:hypothetical protein